MARGQRADLALPRLRPLGEAALTLELGERLDAVTSRRVRAVAQAMRLPAGAGEVVPALTSLSVFFDPERLSGSELADRLLLAAARTVVPDPGRGDVLDLPVFFGGEEGPDLAAVASACGRSSSEVVAALCDLELEVMMIGFLPGFPYLGPLPDWLNLPRRAEPRLRLPAGSVALAGGLAGIYPVASPGGWHLVGRCAVPLFDANDPVRPARLQAGDRVRFVAGDR